MKRIALLGAGGQLGSDIARAAALYKGIDLLPMTRSDIDVEKPGIIKALAVCRGCDVIINCISYHKTDECEDNPEKTFRVNSLFVLDLARFCARNNNTLIQISSDYVFDGNRTKPYLENDPVNPLNVYGASKAVSEFFVRQYAPRFFIIRLSSLFGIAGASGKGGNFVETMLQLACEGKSIKVVDDQYMAPTYSADIARAILELVDRDITDYGIYHGSNSGSCSWYELAKAIFELCSIDADLNRTTCDQYQTRAARPRYSVLDNGKISRLWRMPHWRVALEVYLRAKGHLIAAVNL